MADSPAIVNNVYYGPPQAWLDGIQAKLDTLIAQGANIVTDLSALDANVADIEQKVTEVQGTEASAVTLLNELSALLSANATDPAAIQAIADRLGTSSDAIETSNAALAAAVAANEPPA